MKKHEEEKMEVPLSDDERIEFNHIILMEDFAVTYEAHERALRRQEQRQQGFTHFVMNRLVRFVSGEHRYVNVALSEHFGHAEKHNDPHPQLSDYRG